MSTQTQELERIADAGGLSSSSTSDPGRITQTLKNKAKVAHLVSPATSCPNLPLGCEVAFSTVLINAENKKEAYPIPGGGDLGLSKVSINRISNAAGVSWDALQSGRTDDGKDPWFYSYKAVGFYRHFDGTVVQITGEKTMDLREDSATVASIRKRQKANNTVEKGEKEISQLRMFIGEHAESKAKNRALRGGLSLQTSYTKEELNKPFVVAKLMFTGRVSDADDPTGEIRRIHADNIGRSMLGGVTALFGERGASRELAPPSNHQAPQLGPGTPQDTETVTEPEAWLIPFGQHKGKAISDPEVKDNILSGLVDYYVIALEDPDNAEKKEEFEANLQHIHAEINRRMTLRDSTEDKY